MGLIGFAFLVIFQGMLSWKPAPELDSVRMMLAAKDGKFVATDRSSLMLTKDAGQTWSFVDSLKAAYWKPNAVFDQKKQLFIG